MELKTSAILSSFSNNVDVLLNLFKQLICLKQLDELVVVVRDKETEEKISRLKEIVENNNLTIKVIVDNSCATVPLKYLKELTNELIYILPDTYTFETKVFHKMYESIVSDEKIGFIFTSIKNNKIVTELTSDEKVNYYLCQGELPDILDCYNLGIVKKSLALQTPYQYFAKYFFRHLAEIAKKQSLKYCQLANLRITVEKKDNLIRKFTKTYSSDYNKANYYSLTKEPKMSLLDKIFSIKFAHSRYYLCIFNLKIHLKVNKKITFPKNAIECTYIKENLDPTRIEKVCIFAGFTANGTITENNLNYLSVLKGNFDFIVYVADSKATQDTVDSLKQYCDAIIIKRHEEYDFGSYKLGYQLLSKLGVIKNAKKLLLCNDSVDFIGSKENIANLIDLSEKFDAYSLCTATYGFGEKIKKHDYTWIKYPHLQSYFLLLSGNVFKSNYFDQFINSVTKLHNKTDIIIKYEMGLTKLFNEHGVKYSSYYPYDDSSIVNPFFMYLNPAYKDAIFIKHSLQKL